MKNALILGLLLTPLLGLGNSVKPSQNTAKELIRNRSFAVKRDLVTYLSELPPPLTQDLNQLGPQGRILHGGAGALHFAEELVSLKKLDDPARIAGFDRETRKNLSAYLNKPLNLRPTVVGITLNLERKNIPNYADKLKVFWGRFFSEIPNSELGKFDIIVDLEGVFAYAPNVDEVLTKYMSLLKKGGKLYLYLGDQTSGFAQHSFVNTANNKRLSLAEWVHQLPNIEKQILVGGANAKKYANVETAVLSPIPGTDPVIEKLSLVGVDTHPQGPPVRIYWTKR